MKSIFPKIGLLLGLFAFIILACKNYTKEHGFMDFPTERTADYPIDEQFIKRRSPRAMSGQKVTNEELFTLFEAARWAPSTFNDQPWKFIYAHRDTPAWETIFPLMDEFNQTWAKNAGALVVITSRNVFSDHGAASKYGLGSTPYTTHSFDTGAAWMSIALQGSNLGLVIHPMSGFNYDKAREALNVPEEYTVEALFAVGKPGTKRSLPDYLQDGEDIPSQRKPISEFISEGSF